MPPKKVKSIVRETNLASKKLIKKTEREGKEKYQKFQLCFCKNKDERYLKSKQIIIDLLLENGIEITTDVGNDETECSSHLPVFMAENQDREKGIIVFLVKADKTRVKLHKDNITPTITEYRKTAATKTSFNFDELVVYISIPIV